MQVSRLIASLASLSLAASLIAQEPAGGGSPSKSSTTPISAAAIAGAKQDPAAFERGGKAFAASCAGCHGAAAKGGPGAPDLVRSVLVLDDEKGLLIAPVIREGRPDKGMPKLNLTEDQIADIVAWLHVQTYAAGHRVTYVFQNVVTGDAKKGAAYFNGAGKCNTCHSVTGDLAGLARKYDPFSLQERWLEPQTRKKPGALNSPAELTPGTTTVTVTLASGESISGALDHVDDFTVALFDSKGNFHSFARDTATPPKVQIRNPLSAHLEMLHHYTDADIHNITAYLVTLK